MEKNHNCNPSACFCEIDTYLKSIVSDSVIAWNETINVINTAQINADDVINYCILDTDL